MAKGKKSSGKQYVSVGEHSNVAKSTTKAIRKQYLASGDRIINQLKAFRAGKHVMITIENPNKNETNKRFIRVSASTNWKTLAKYNVISEA